MTSVSAHTVSALASAAQLAPSADNSQPWHLHWDGAKLHLQYDAKRVAGKTFPADSPSTLLSIGSVIEIILTCAMQWGVTARFSPSDTPGADNDYGYFELCNEAPSPAVPPPAVGERHCNRLSYKSAAVNAALIDKYSAATQGKARCVTYTNTTALKSLAQLAKQASQIRFQTEEVHKWLGRSLRFDRESIAQGDGLDVNTLDLPPGGGLFLRMISDWNTMRRLNRVGAYRLLSHIDAAPLAKGPAIACIVAPATLSAALDAGRLLQRVWGLINADGLAAHPYYVIADQLARLDAGLIGEQHLGLAQSIKRDTEAALGLTQGETLHMMLRLGEAKKTAVRSKRVPLDKILSGV